MMSTPTQSAPQSHAAAGQSLDLADIQGDILRAYGNDYDCTTYLFIAVASPESGRAWLRELAGEVSSAAPWTGAKPTSHLNVALTCEGLHALGVPPGVIGSFSSEFQEGMAARAARLGDVGTSAPEHWDSGLGTGGAHVLVTVNAIDPAVLDAALTRVRAGLAEHGHGIVARQDAALLPASREHFGFADGFAQPAIEGASEDRKAGGGVPLKHHDWRALAPGEFILGYPDEDTVADPERRLPHAPDGALGRSGTYMVWRKLHQDVALFRRTLKAAAEHYEEGNEAKLRAKVVGRWENGAPLSHYPDEPPAEFDGSRPGANDFRFREGDEAGGRCPVGAHIRRTNPRDGLGWEGRLSFRHRIIRRGMPYGEELPEGVLEDDGADRGLVFVCFNASISRQFEAIQVQWVSDGNVFGLGHDSDFLMGSQTGGSMVVQGECPFYLGPQGRFVDVRGGEYLYVPGLEALRAIADGIDD
jgi:Dyp-type peroxidase family